MTSCNAKPITSLDGKVLAAYGIFLLVAFTVCYVIAQGEFSAVLTAAVIFQCLAFSLLGIQMSSAHGLHGISSQTLILDALAIACRLSSTTWLNGYLPEDVTGDHIYQIIDMVSLVMVLGLVYNMMKVELAKHGFDEEQLSAKPFAVGAFTLACILHGDLNDRPLFDALWLCGLFLSTISVVPQLWLMARGNTNVPALTSHFVAVMALSRVLSGTYMWHAHEEVTCVHWLGGFNYTGFAILAAHGLHLLLLADYMFFYCKNVASSGLQGSLELRGAWIV